MDSKVVKPTYIASCSFGKDSLATILLALEHNEPLDRAVFCEVMFDNARGISGELPEHIEWVHKVAIPKLESYGVKVDVLRAERDYIYYFRNGVRGGEKYKGKLYGFPIGGRCVIQRDCKLVPIREYYRQFEGQIVQYIGIAADEQNRLQRLKNTKRISKVSLLAKYGVTEAMAVEMCKDAGLYSPMYDIAPRGGCWFCPNVRIKTLVEFRRKHPELWAQLLELGKTPNLCSYGFKYGKTVEEIDARLDFEDKQLKLF